MLDEVEALELGLGGDAEDVRLPEGEEDRGAGAEGPGGGAERAERLDAQETEAAAVEQEAMAAAVKTKFEGKVLSWLKAAPSWPAQMKPLAHQSFTVNSFKDNIVKKGALKGTAESMAEKGWAFSVILTDHAMYGYVPNAPESDGEAPEGVDAL